MIAVYVRVSTERQITASQDSELAAWIAKNDIGPHERYVDHASGTKMDRSDFNRMMGDIESGKVSKIVIWRLDRLGRTAAGLTTLFTKLTELKVTLISIRDQFDLSTPSGRLMANVLASVAQFETEVRRERQMAGIIEAKKRGVYSKPRKPKGTKKKPKRAWELKEQGLSAPQIAAVMKVSLRTVWNYLDAVGYNTPVPPPMEVESA
jgi:DNA invertase Pin-like site-specific DNA recombinase